MDDVETQEIARLRKLAQTRPDLARIPAELFAAAYNNRPRVVKFLLDSGVKAEGSEALITAAGQGSLEVVKLLLAHSKELVASDGGKALSIAAASGYAAVVRALLAANLDPNWQPVACVAPQAPDLNISPGNGIGTPLMEAIRNGRKEIVVIL